MSKEVEMRQLLRRLLEVVDETDERGESVLGRDHTGAVNWLFEFAEEVRPLLSEASISTATSTVAECAKCPGCGVPVIMLPMHADGLCGTCVRHELLKARSKVERVRALLELEEPLDGYDLLQIVKGEG